MPASTFGIRDSRRRRVAGPGRGERSMVITLAPAARASRQNDSFTNAWPLRAGGKLPIRQTVAVGGLGVDSKVQRSSAEFVVT